MTKKKKAAPSAPPPRARDTGALSDTVPSPPSDAAAEVVIGVRPGKEELLTMALDTSVAALEDFAATLARPFLVFEDAQIKRLPPAEQHLVLAVRAAVRTYNELKAR